MGKGQQPLNAICAVVVAYYPDHAQLDRLAQQLQGQVDRMVVVDNSDSLDHPWFPSLSLASFVELITLGENLGVGYAQNVGIKWARERGARFVLLLDQDSLPMPGMVTSLASSLSSTRINGLHQPLVAGPELVDEGTGEHSIFLPSTDVASCSDARLSVVATRLTVASGMFIDVRAFDLVGLMREDYFIDWIDIEWVMRLHQAGYYSVGVLNATLQHNEGEVLKAVWFIPGKKIPHHQPFRHYYRVRNQLLIFRDLPVPMRYKMRRLVGLVKYFSYFTIFGDRRLERMRFMGLGFWHGLMNVRGRL